MTKDLLNTLVLAACFLALFGLAELLYHRLKVKVELSRKIVHVGTGLLTLLFPLMLSNHLFVLLLCGSFAILLICSLRFNFLPSINAIERKSVGSIAYPVSVYGCYLAYDYFGETYFYFYLPILILAISDPLAALAGKKWPIGKYKIGHETKTLMGSSMFFLSALLLVLVFYKPSDASGNTGLTRVLISLVATASEALSRKGFDNISIPASVLLTLVILQN